MFINIIKFNIYLYYRMSKTKKINNRRRKNKTRKTRMMMGGTITMEGNKFVARGNSVKNRLQAKFYNEDLPDLFGLPRNDAFELIEFLKNPKLDNELLQGNIGIQTQLNGNYESEWGYMAYISSHETLPKLGIIIKVFVERKLGTLTTSGQKIQLLQKIKDVQASLRKQIEEREKENYDKGHGLYVISLKMNVVRPLEESITSLTEIIEGAGERKEENEKSLNEEGKVDMSLFPFRSPTDEKQIDDDSNFIQQQSGFSSSNPLSFLDKFKLHKAEEEQATKKSPAPPVQQQACPHGWETQTGYDNFCFKWYNHPNVAVNNQKQAAELIKEYLYEKHKINPSDVIITTGQSQCKPGFKIGIKNLKNDIPELSKEITAILNENNIPVLERQCQGKDNWCKNLINLFFPRKKNDERSIGNLLKKITTNKNKKAIRLFLGNQNVGKCKLLTDHEIDNFIRILRDLNEIYNPKGETKHNNGTNLLSHINIENDKNIFLKVKAIVDFVSYYPQGFQVLQGGNKKRKIKTKKRKIFRQRKKKPKTRKIDRYKKTIKTK